MGDNQWSVVIAICLGLGLILALFWLPTVQMHTVWADASIRYVAPDGDDGKQCDSIPDRCRTVQRAIDAANDLDEIRVATGTYTDAAGTVASLTKTVTLLGGWNGSFTVRDPDDYLTTLNAQRTGPVVTISGNISPTIDGFVITGGRDPDGGGVYVYDAAPIIQNNVITANQTIDGGSFDDGRGGGIFVGGASNALIAQNRILSNTSGYGAGIYHYGTVAITITANEVAGNAASHRGGGIMVERPADMVQSNLISGNTAAQDGGGVQIWAAAPTVEANRITGNSAQSGGGVSMGNNASPSLLNNLLISNTQDGLLVWYSSPVVVNNTIVGSGLLQPGDGISLWSISGCTPTSCTRGSFTNNIISGYEVGIFGFGVITPVIDYNDVWGNTTADYFLPASVVTGAHNISLDPLFINPAAQNYHLQGGSPCIDAGDPAGVPPAPPTDIDGQARPAGGRVDIGADEVPLNSFLPVVLRNYPP